MYIRPCGKNGFNTFAIREWTTNAKLSISTLQLLMTKRNIHEDKAASLSIINERIVLSIINKPKGNDLTCKYMQEFLCAHITERTRLD